MAGFEVTHHRYVAAEAPLVDPLAGTVRLRQLITNVEGVVVQLVHGMDSHPAQ